MGRKKSGVSRAREELGSISLTDFTNIHSSETLFCAIPLEIETIAHEQVQSVRWRWPEKGEAALIVKQGKELRGCLAEFCRLKDASDPQILAFIKRWGVLAYWPSQMLKKKQGEEYQYFIEPLEIYKKDALFFDTLFSILTDLTIYQRSKTEDWKILYPKYLYAQWVSREGEVQRITKHEDLADNPFAAWQYLCHTCMVGLENVGLRLSPHIDDTTNLVSLHLASPHLQALEPDMMDHLVRESQAGTPVDVTKRLFDLDTYAPHYLDKWSYVYGSNTSRASPLQSVLMAQFLFMLLTPGITTCAICGTPCRLKQRGRKSYCGSEECERERNRSDAKVSMRKKRASSSSPLMKDHDPES